MRELARLRRVYEFVLHKKLCTAETAENAERIDVLVWILSLRGQLGVSGFNIRLYQLVWWVLYYTQSWVSSELSAPEGAESTRHKSIRASPNPTGPLRGHEEKEPQRTPRAQRE